MRKELIKSLCCIISAINIFSSASILKINSLESSSYTENPSCKKTADFQLPTFKTLKGECEFYSALNFNGSKKAAISDSAYFPAYYDMREYGLISSVKNQGDYSTCWAHSSASCAETDFIKYNPSVSLSELHTAYYCWSGGDQMYQKNQSSDKYSIFQNGGSCFAVTNLWAQWLGPVSESLLPYNDMNFIYDAELVDKYKYYSDYHLQNAYLFDYNDDRSNYNQVNNTIKNFVKSGKSVDAAYCNKTDYYDYVNYSYITNASPDEANHSITIIGWDDNFPSKNFQSKYCPENNGAWLVKNSWGTDWMDNGFFWVSYEETSLCEFAVYELESNDNYDFIFQHDSFIPAQNMSSAADEYSPSYYANVFTADDDCIIEAASTYFSEINTEYEISVYTDIENNSEISLGKASAVTSGKVDITGYMTISLDEPVEVERGERFAVVVKAYCPDNEYIIPIETCSAFIDRDSGEIYEAGGLTQYSQIKENTSKGESFYSENGIDWIDVTEEDFTFSDAQKESVLDQIEEAYGKEKADTYREFAKNADLSITMGNISLKAFGSKKDKVRFSHSEENMPLNEKLELSSVNNKPVFYSVNGDEFTEYTEPVSINEAVEITASVDNINYYTKSFKPAKAELNDLLYKGNSLSEMHAERINESHYVINVDKNTDSITFMPISQGKVTLLQEDKETELSSYKYMEDYLSIPYGTTNIKLKLTQENRLDNEVILTINSAVRGDIDENGVIDAIDASLALTIYACISTSKPTEMTEQQMINADVDKNGIVDAIDASEILTYYALVSTGKK